MPLTEKLDYFSAFSIVVYTLLTFFLRMLGSWRSAKGVQWSNLAAILACVILFFRLVGTYFLMDLSFNAFKSTVLYD